MDFLETPLSGNVKAFIVFDPSTAASDGDADRIIDAISNTLKLKGATFNPQKIAVSTLTDIEGPGVIFLAAGLEPHYQAVKEIALTKELITISAEASCVQSGHCMVGVQSSPRVEITINRATTEAAGIKFRPAFMMMVKSI